VMGYLKAEWPEQLVQMRFEFSDQQMRDVLAYVEAHPEEVEADYIAGRERAKEERRVWREKFENGELVSDEKSEEKKEWPTWWPADAIPGAMIHIIESDCGPMISESQTSVYDVMEAYDEGYPPNEIREIYNLSSYQAKVALQYIEAHRETLEPELKELLIRKAERERYHREFAAAVTKWRRETNPPEMTPQRAALKALLEERRRARGELECR